MAAKPVNGSGNGARSGAQTLVLLATPLNVTILRALAEGPKQQVELRRAADSAPQTTLRAQLKKLAAINALEVRRRNRFPGVLEYEQSATGRELLFVASVLEHWLGEAPAGPLELGGNPGKAAVKALAGGWSTTMLRALAAQPLSLTQLDGLIGSISYPTLERRLGAMRLTGLVEPCPGDVRGTPYTVTPWLRRGVAPLAAAARWERQRLTQGPPFGRIDIEAIFLLSVPHLRIPDSLSGSCRIAAEIQNGNRPSLAGVLAHVRNGTVTSCSTHLQGMPNAWVLGSPGAWLSALIDQDRDRLEIGGDSALGSALIDSLHEALFRGASTIYP